MTGSRHVGVLGWPQGTIEVQWALKHWPSTREIVDDFISLSGDYRGTDLAFVLCPYFPKLPCPPSVIQQSSSSNFITNLRSDGGDSAYVPTTCIFSATDEIVQTGDRASRIIYDWRGVGVTNTELQEVCVAQAAGLFFPHEGLLYNNLAFALAKDALTHEGPGRLDRLDLGDVCSQAFTPGLGLLDVIGTESSIAVAVAAIGLYQPKQILEPSIKQYAL